MPKVALHTLGCKLNFAETATIGKQFLDRGFEVVEFGEEADVCVINTCSVTGHADRECRQIIRRASRSKRKPVVIVTGCYAQLEPEEIASMEGVDLVLGAKEKFSVFDFLPANGTSLGPAIHVTDIGSVHEFGPAFSTEAGSRTRAFLKVQDGCDYTCSFCTIPQARGGSRSQSMREVIDQARVLVSQGYKEIVLTGVNVGDYGRSGGTNLFELLRMLSRVDGLARLRVSSIEPNLLTDAIIDLIASTNVLCPHVHVPLQSGSDAVLRLMRRRYTTSGYADLMSRIRATLPDAGIGADVIVGFPGETDRDFDATYRFLSELDLSYLHVFTYSERPNTLAAKFANRVEQSRRERRNAMLRVLSQKKRHAFSRRMIGKQVRILTERDVAQGLRFGFTDNYIRVGIPAHRIAANTLVDAFLSEIRGDAGIGTLVVEGGCA